MFTMEQNNNVYKCKPRKDRPFEKSDKISELFVLQFLTAVVAGVCYSNSLDGDFVHDDIYAIKTNRDVTGNSTLLDVFKNDFWGKSMWDNSSHKSYRPLCILTFRLNYYLGGYNPYGFHVVNVVLHSLMTWLFTYVCRTVISLPPWCSTIAGLLFAVHPVHTEAVAGIVGRADILAGILFLLSLVCYIRSLDITSMSAEEFPVTKHPHLFAASLVLSAMSMLCKEHGITVLGVCLLYDLTICCRTGLLRMCERRQVDKACLPFVKRLCAVICVFLVLMLLRLWVMNFQLPPFHELDNPASFSPHFLTRFLTYSYLLVFNVGLLLFPITLCYDWQVGSIPLVESWRDPRNLASAALFGILAIFVHRIYRNLKDKCNTEHPDVLLISLLLVIVPFLPASNLFFRVGFVVAERVLYIPSVGFCVCVAYGLYLLIEKHDSYRYISLTALVALLAILYCKTQSQNLIWHSRESLFRSGVLTLPHNAKTHYNYANYLKDIGQREEAQQHYEVTLGLFPNYSSGHNNLGTLLVNETEAEYHFRRALSIYPSHKGAHINLGNLLFKQGHKVEGVQLVRRCLELDEHNVEAYLTLAGMLTEMGNLSEAEHFLRVAIEEKPDFADVYNNYGVYLDKKGQFEDAVGYFQQAYFLDSQHTVAMVNAARDLRQLGRMDEAEILLNQALAVRRDTNTLDQLALLYLHNGRLQDSKSLYEEILNRSPNNTEAMTHYAQVLFNNHERDKAQSLLMQILTVEPEHPEALRQMANILGMQGKHQEALPYLDAAVARVRHTGDPVYLAKLLFELGNHYKDLKMYRDALEAYLETVKYDPTKTRALLNLGAIYHLNGDWGRARQYYTKVLKLEPDNSIVEENLAKLKRLEDKKRKSGPS